MNTSEKKLWKKYGQVNEGDKNERILRVAILKASSLAWVGLGIVFN